MRSVPLALTWEMLARGSWLLLGAFLVATALPAIILIALHLDGDVDPEHPALIVIHLVLMQVNMMIFTAALMTAQGHPKRLYALPVTTTSIVAWHLLPAMALMALEAAASTALLNALFHLHWPVWGPAFLLAVGLAAVHAAIWLTEKSLWLPWAVAVAVGALGLWYKSQHGAMFSQPDHFWLHVSAWDVATLLAAGALAFAVAVVAIARDRRGQPLGSLGIVAWIERVLNPNTSMSRPFRSPLAAQTWYEWRHKGWAMPATVAFGLFMGFGGWLIFSRDPQALWQGFLAGGLILSAVGIVGGLVHGHSGPSDTNVRMNQFLATRPITTPALAQITLKAIAGSVLLAWALWAGAMLAVYLIVIAIPGQPRPQLLPDLGGWYFPVTLLGMWTVAGVSASLMLTGRPHLLTGTALAGIFLFIGGSIGSKIFLEPPAREQLSLAIYAAIGVISILAAIAAYVAAGYRGLIDKHLPSIAAAAWVVCGTVVLFWSFRQTSGDSRYYTLFYLGLLALALMPLAAAPLALAWNRTR